MKFPCEIVGWYLLPGIRRGLVKCMVTEMGMPRKDVAEKLGLTEAAVCQYLKEKRGAKVAIGGEYLKMVREISGKIAKSRGNPEAIFMSETCALCSQFRKAGLLCGLHRKEGAPRDCRFC